MKNLSILGSTGSIGRSTLELVALNPESFNVVALTAGRNLKLLRSQIRDFKPKFVSVLNGSSVKGLRKEFPSVKFGFGVEGTVEAASLSKADTVVSAIVGAAGLLPTLSAIRAGKDLALANKESLVIAGPLVMGEVKKYGVKLLPIDSEHSAVYQSLKGHRKKDVKDIILTASGGPFLKRPIKSFGSITPKEALKHPTWTMGRRITIDSATLMNKGFEVIEARWLFGLKGERIKVTIHPESIVHSMVEYVDGSIISQMGDSDMKGPISYALGHPARLDKVGMKPFTLSGKTLRFIEPSLKRFPCLGLAYRALEQGASAPAVLNAADEVAVDMFLKGNIRFTGIYDTLEAVLSSHKVTALTSVEDVLEADRWARRAAKAHVKKIAVN